MTPFKPLPGRLPEVAFMTTLRVVGLNPLDGAANWEFALPFQPGGTSPTPLVIGDRIVTSTMSNGTTALRVTAGEKVTAEKEWQAKALSGYFSSGVASKDRAFYRDRGFTPVTIVNQSAPAETLALSEALFRHLDRDNGGKLSAAELRRAAGLLNRLDENEDEVLTAAELLGENRAEFQSRPAGLKLASPEKATPDATLRLALSGKPALTGASEVFELSADGARLRVPGGVCSVRVTKADPTTAFRAAKSFYLAQFKATTGDKPARKQVFDDDPTAQVLAGLFDSADRDGDGKLTRAELEALFDLIELGIACRVLVTATDRGRNLFDLFDTNGDGRLDLDELIRAGRNLPGALARDKPLERNAVPASYQLTVSRGPIGDSFGPVPFGAAPKPKPPLPPAARGPAWFRAMDKNGDGYVSAREFIGAPDLFTKLDTNGDGRISTEEAESTNP